MATTATTHATSQPDEQIVIKRPTNMTNSRGRVHAADVFTASSFETRALALATARHYAPAETMHWHTTADGNASYLVHADSRDLPYHVSIHPETDHQHSCTCPAGEHGRPCKHIGICLLLWTQFDRPAWAQERSF